jgi:Flp pilus assembly protein TadG
MTVLSRIAASLRRWRRNRDATAALEFALVAPTMLFVVFGSVELTNALQTNRRVENVAASLADVVSRDDSVSDSEIADLWNAAEPLMWPTSDSGMQVRISSVSIVSAGEARVVWSEGHGGYAPRPANSTVELPSAMMTPGSSVIMGEVIYPYEPALGFVFGPGGLHSLLDPGSESRGGYNITHTSVRRSRLVDPIPREH